MNAVKHIFGNVAGACNRGFRAVLHRDTTTDWIGGILVASFFFLIAGLYGFLEFRNATMVSNMPVTVEVTMTAYDYESVGKALESYSARAAEYEKTLEAGGVYNVLLPSAFLEQEARPSVAPDAQVQVE